MFVVTPPQGPLSSAGGGGGGVGEGLILCSSDLPGSSLVVIFKAGREPGDKVACHIVNPISSSLFSRKRQTFHTKIPRLRSLPPPPPPPPCKIQANTCARGDMSRGCALKVRLIFTRPTIAITKLRDYSQSIPSPITLFPRQQPCLNCIGQP